MAFLVKVLIHTSEDGNTHWIKGKGVLGKKTLCGKKLHPISTIYAPKMPITCIECGEIAEGYSYTCPDGEIIEEI